MNHQSVADIRRDYQLKTLVESDLHSDPLQQFSHWFDEAVEVMQFEANAMTLATATPDGKPSLRIVLLKGIESGAFVFYTNYESKKGKEIALNPNVSVVFFWHPLERQVIVEGRVEKVSPEESEAYFQSRPLESRLGAWASQQSRDLPDRETLEARFRDVQALYPDGNIPKPPYWGGYRIIPERLEFWQGRPGRLHDRLVYEKNGTTWEIHRLSP